MQENVVEEIVRGGRCTGCGACVAALPHGKLQMRMDEFGYLRPHADSTLNDEDEEVVLSVCGGDNLVQPNDSGISYNPNWGLLNSVETAFSTDEEVRYKGSSGGVISSIALHLIETRKVDFVLQTGVDSADPVSNAAQVSLARKDILSAAGSRYAPSAPLADLECHLQRGVPFAFIGKPCDVAALRKMALRDPRIDALVPYMLAFFCAGVPSRNGALAVLDKLGVQFDDLAAFTFRGMGWPGLTRATRHDGTQETMDYNSSWGMVLSRHLQFRCKVCVDGTGEFADIVCADAWYGKDGYPDFAERDGRSLLITRNDRGRALIDEMVISGKLSTEPLDVGEIQLMQPYQYERKRNLLARLLGVILKGHRPPRYRGFRLWQLTVGTPPWILARSFFGTWRRARFGRRLN